MCKVSCFCQKVHDFVPYPLDYRCYIIVSLIKSIVAKDCGRNLFPFLYDSFILFFIRMIDLQLDKNTIYHLKSTLFHLFFETKEINRLILAVKIKALPCCCHY